MMRSGKKRTILLLSGCLAALAALAVVGFGVEAGRGTKERKAAITAEQVIASIRTAVAAKPGKVRGVEVEDEGGKTVCGVEILGDDGKGYEVEVDAGSNTVIEVEEEND